MFSGSKSFYASKYNTKKSVMSSAFAIYARVAFAQSEPVLVAFSLVPTANPFEKVDHLVPVRPAVAHVP